MMWQVYILKSKKSNRFYIGYTGNLGARLELHNSRMTKSTKSGVPWFVIYSESFNKRNEAIAREKKIKSYKSGNAFKKLVGGVA